MDQDPKEQARLLGNIAAHLRGELSNLRLAAGLLAPADAREHDPELDRKAAMLDQAYYRLVRLVNDLSLASGYLDGSRPFRFRDRDVVELVRRICEETISLAELRQVDLRFICAMDQRICAVDAGALELLLYHLLSNALKFTPAGGKIAVELKVSAGRLSLIVTDTGQGIAPEQLDTLFDRYLREDTAAPPPHGLGLGLPLCRLIAEAHGGVILARSKEGEGAQFTFSFPEKSSGVVELSDIEVDYGGAFNRTLLALADALPARAFMVRSQG